MKRFLIALQFLTILPVNIKSDLKEEDFGASLLCFPLIGLLLGVLLAATALFFSFLPGFLLATLILIISVIATGAIHLDGFADTCDGLYGARSREKILEIMRDSRIGVMGVIGIVCLLLLKVALMTSIPAALLWKTLIAMPVFARWSQSLACYASNYARTEGKAKYFIEYARKKDVILGGALAFVLLLLMLRLKGAFVFALAFLAVWACIKYIKGRIGGMTGDTIGAVNEIAEAGVLVSTLISGSIWI